MHLILEILRYISFLNTEIAQVVKEKKILSKNIVFQNDLQNADPWLVIVEPTTIGVECSLDGLGKFVNWKKK